MCGRAQDVSLLSMFNISSFTGKGFMWKGVSHGLESCTPSHSTDLGQLCQHLSTSFLEAPQDRQSTKYDNSAEAVFLG